MKYPFSWHTKNGCNNDHHHRNKIQMKQKKPNKKKLKLKNCSIWKQNKKRLNWKRRQIALTSGNNALNVEPTPTCHRCRQWWLTKSKTTTTTFTTNHTTNDQNVADLSILLLSNERKIITTTKNNRYEMVDCGYKIPRSLTPCRMRLCGCFAWKWPWRTSPRKSIFTITNIVRKWSLW